MRGGTSFVTTATETIFHWSEWVEGQSLRACLWIPSGSKLDSPAHDPEWGGRVQDVADLEPYHDVLRTIRKAISQWKITENNLRRLECWIEAEHVRTIRYLDELAAVAPAENELPGIDDGERPEPPEAGTQETNGVVREHSPWIDGPVPPNKLQWNGKAVDVEPLVFRLIEYMWTRDRAEGKAVVDIIWGTDSDKTYHNLKDPISKAGKTLVDVGVPWSLSRKDGFVLKTQ